MGESLMAKLDATFVELDGTVPNATPLPTALPLAATQPRQSEEAPAFHHSGMPKNWNRSAASYFFLAAFALLRSSSSWKWACSH